MNNRKSNNDATTIGLFNFKICIFWRCIIKLIRFRENYNLLYLFNWVHMNQFCHSWCKTCSLAVIIYIMHKQFIWWEKVTKENSVYLLFMIGLFLRKIYESWLFRNRSYSMNHKALGFSSFDLIGILTIMLELYRSILFYNIKIKQTIFIKNHVLSNIIKNLIFKCLHLEKVEKYQL